MEMEIVEEAEEAVEEAEALEKALAEALEAAIPVLELEVSAVGKN